MFFFFLCVCFVKNTHTDLAGRDSNTPSMLIVEALPTFPPMDPCSLSSRREGGCWRGSEISIAHQKFGTSIKIGRVPSVVEVEACGWGWFKNRARTKPMSSIFNASHLLLTTPCQLRTLCLTEPFIDLFLLRCVCNDKNSGTFENGLKNPKKLPSLHFPKKI